MPDDVLNIQEALLPFTEKIARARDDGERDSNASASAPPSANSKGVAQSSALALAIPARVSLRRVTVAHRTSGLKLVSVVAALGVSACALDYAKEDGFFDRAQAKDMRTQVEETHECPPGKHWGHPPRERCKVPKDCRDQCLDDVAPP